MMSCEEIIAKEEEIIYTCSSPNDMYSSSNNLEESSICEESDKNNGSSKADDRSPESPEQQQFCSSTTQSHNDSGMIIIEEEQLKEDMQRRLCLVCGDVASGFHYGVASCEACKAFFKRTIQGNIEYTCPANGMCEINKRRRKACQACRFRKCLRSGMMKEGVRLDRVRGGRQKYKRNPDSSYHLQVHRTSALEEIKMLEALAACEPDVLEIQVDSLEVKANKHKYLTVLSDLYDRELVGIIGWAKQIPGFTDLPLNDQMRLLQSTWAEILTLTLAFRSIPLLNMGMLSFATDFTMDEKACIDCGAQELYQTCCHVAERLENLGIMKEEYFLLKALILANSDARIEHSSALKTFRDNILLALSDTTVNLRNNGAVNHMHQLLLCLPALRQADYVVRRFWSDVHQQDLVPMNKLFLEMLEAYCR